MTSGFDEDAFDRFLNEEIIPKAQAQGDKVIQEAVREVLVTHSGRPAAEVREALEAAFREREIAPEEPGFSQVVESIADGSMRDE
jgi:hypothetical protein